jgi:hypothetical protein
MTPAESNKALVRRFYEEIDKGNIEVLDECSLRITSTTTRHPSPDCRRDEKE